jgi:hypothetical protein
MEYPDSALHAAFGGKVHHSFRTAHSPYGSTKGLSHAVFGGKGKYLVVSLAQAKVPPSPARLCART